MIAGRRRGSVETRKERKMGRRGRRGRKEREGEIPSSAHFD